MRHAALRADHGLRADVQVAGEAGLSADDHVVTQSCAAGDAHLGGDQAVFANHDIVGDLDEVVDFGSFTNAGFAKARAVDRGVGANFHIVLDDGPANLRDFFVNAFVGIIAKTI